MSLERTAMYYITKNFLKSRILTLLCVLVIFQRHTAAAPMNDFISTIKDATASVKVNLPGFVKAPEIVQESAAHSEWGYKDQTDELPPQLWKALYPLCAGTRQSPIAIETDPLVSDPALDNLDVTAYADQPIGNNWTLVDNGHTVQFTAKYRSAPQLQQGSLGAGYELTQFHFHWGAADDRGSEHVINGKRYPLELHLVHRKVGESDADALTDTTGLAVIGVLFEMAGPNDRINDHFTVLADAVRLATTPNVPVTVTLPDVRLADILPASPSYYRYLGSLTTPPCAEAVIWTVMKQPVKISRSQLEAFRSLRPLTPAPSSRALVRTGGADNFHQMKDEFLVDNYRPVQQSAGRQIRYHPEIWTTFV